ncbi:MAG: hypothetical protein KAJ19_28550, partial [Gammaproteobacteria bacterium]|nr:hypothetical protein [Gammaproteobacteria bacterium]
MSKKKGNFFEQYVDKIVLAVAAILSIWLLWTFVLGSPYAHEISGQKLGPGEIDGYVQRRARQLEEKLQERTVPAPYDKKHREEFAAIFDCSIDGVPNFTVPVPGVGDVKLEEKRIYRMPEIGDVTEVAVAAIRGVADVPIEEIGPDKPYATVQTQSADIDFVSVEASFDIEGLYRDFYQSFAGTRVGKAEWRDDGFALPVFAAVELQRQHLLGNGQWSGWQPVPHTQIEHLKEKLDVPQDVAELDYGIDFIKTTFASPEIQRSILQPGNYNFTSLPTE